MAADRKVGGNGCLLVATGQFMPLETKQYALLLPPRVNGFWRLIVAYQEARTWRFHTLSTWNAPDARPFVDVIEPGTYETIADLEAHRSASEDGHVERITSSRPGILAGTLESSDVAYFYSNGAWQHVWLSD